MPYNAIISRTDADGVIPTEVAGDVLKAAVQSSAALALSRRATMSSKLQRQPVLSVLPQAYWVAGDTGLKMPSNAAFEGLELTAEEIAVRGTKTAGSRREVPLIGRALAALDRLPARLDTPLLFPAPEGGPLSLNNFRRRMWTPAVEASGIAKPARIYDLRSTFASNALAAGVTVFELAKVMGTSVAMIERCYGTLIAGAHAGIADRLERHEALLAEDAAEQQE
jgi:hypothetical protein